MDTIPIELIDMICYYLTLKERCQFMITCKDYYKVVKSNKFFEYCENKCINQLNYLFKKSFDNLKFTKLLYYLYPQIDISIYNFNYACEYGYLETATWLISLNQNVNIHAQDEFVFRYADPEIKQWLTGIGRNR